MIGINLMQEKNTIRMFYFSGLLFGYLETWEECNNVINEE